MKMRFLPDKPISQGQADELGFGEFVNLLKESIHNTEAPFVYGILGDWGVGKTSTLRMLESQFQDDLDNGSATFVPIWFNAWEYENEVNMIYPLIFKIRKDYEKRFEGLEQDKKFFQGFLAATEASLFIAGDLLLRATTKKLIDEAFKLEDIQKQFKDAAGSSLTQLDSQLEKVFEGWADKVSELHEAFENLLDAYAEDIAASPQGRMSSSADVRFVILIDDLDRCLPGTAISILESIKNYLTVKNCFFVLGVNPNVIYQGIKVKYQGLEINGREYLEKILNYSFYVPEPELTKVSDFVVTRLNELVLEESSRQKLARFFQEFGAILQNCQFNNPRKIKRVLNRYLFFVSKYEDDIEKYHNANTVRLIILAEYFPSLFQLFLKEKRNLHDGESSLWALQKLLTEVITDSSIETFERKNGISIKLIYPQLARMSRLFELRLDHSDGAVSLGEHIEHVFQITRLI
jgi:predicted KAP-like P-loop ATPase